MSFILTAGPPGSGEDEGSAAADGSDGAGCSSTQRSDFSFQNLYWVLPGFTAFYLVLLGFILVLLNFVFLSEVKQEVRPNMAK